MYALLVNGAWYRADSADALVTLVRKVRKTAKAVEFYTKDGGVIGVEVRMPSGTYYHYEGVDFKGAFHVG